MPSADHLQPPVELGPEEAQCPCLLPLVQKEEPRRIFTESKRWTERER